MRLRSEIAALLGPVLLLSMLFVPTAYKPFKVVLIAILVLIIVADAIRRRRLALHPSVALWVAIYVVAGLLFVGWGLARGAPGARDLATLYIVWPAAYILLVAGVVRYNLLRRLETVLVVAAWAIIAYTLALLLVALDILPAALFVGLNVEPVIGFYPGYTQVHLTTLPSMLYLVPFLFAAGVAARWQTVSRSGRVSLWAACFFGIAMLLFTFRRGIIVAVAAAPFVLAFLLSFGPARRRIGRRQVVLATLVILAVAVAAGVVAALIVHWRPDNMLQFFLAGFGLGGSTDDPGAVVRTLQLQDLLRAWTSSPIIGMGAGAYVPTQVRDPEMPWAYELSYVALLLQTGIVGVALYAAGVVWVFWMGIRMTRAAHPLGIRLVPILTATACFLIANATNPYLAKWDFLWVIFLPVAYVNAWLLDQAEPGRGSIMGVQLG